MGRKVLVSCHLDFMATGRFGRSCLPELKSIPPMFHCPSLSLKKGIERFPYDLEMKTREQNKKNKRDLNERERFDWFIEQIQTRVAFVKRTSGEKTLCPRTF